jgi:hypothetical protein
MKLSRITAAATVASAAVEALGAVAQAIVDLGHPNDAGISERHRPIPIILTQLEQGKDMLLDAERDPKCVSALTTRPRTIRWNRDGLLEATSRPI